MKRIIGVTLVVLTGILIGFFGAFNAVFSDGVLRERLTVIAIVLLVYGVLGFKWGYIAPDFSWKVGLLLAVPGAVFVGLFLVNELQAFMMLYVVLILIVPMAGAWSGSRLRKSKSGHDKESR